MVGMGFKNKNILLMVFVFISLVLAACNVGDLLTPSPEIDLPKAFIKKSGFEPNHIYDSKLYWSADNTAFFWQGSFVDPKTNSEDLSPLYMTNIQTKQTREIDTNGRQVNALHMSGDGKTLYFIDSLDTTYPSIYGTCLYEYKLDTDKLEAYLCDVFSQHKSKINSPARIPVMLAFSPDNQHLAYQINDSIFLYDLMSKESRLLLDASSSASLAYPYYGTSENIDSRLFSPDGSQLLVLVNSKPAVFTISTGELKPLTLPLPTPTLVDEEMAWGFIAELRWAQEGILLITKSDAASSSHTIYNLSTGSKQDIQLLNNGADPELFIETSILWSWSKANDKVAYRTRKCLAKSPYGNGCPMQSYLNIYNRQTNKLSVIAKNGEGIIPSISNDGKKIVFSVYEQTDNTTSIYLIDVAQ